jgi:glycosyltransferase involved in cell wall biosynthesis
LRVVFVGRLVPYKGADMVLEAAAPLLRSGALALEIVGDGPQRRELEALAAREHVQGAVTFTGWIDHIRVHECYEKAHVLAFPSIREFGGGVVLEAMALGVVPLVVRYGGPADLVTPETGLLLDLGNRQDIVRQLGDTLRVLIAHPEEIERRSPLARARVLEEFTWKAKARKMHAIYDWVLGNAPRPPFDPPMHAGGP